MHIKTLEGMITLMAEYYGRSMSTDQKEIVKLMANDFRSENLDVKDIQRAWNQWRKIAKHNRMPTPGELIAILKPQLNPRDEAIRRLSMIKQAVKKFGWIRPKEAEEFLGTEIWTDVLRMGGWRHLCENPDCNINDSTIYAQMRDGITSSVQAARDGIDYEAPALPDGKNKVLEMAAGLSRKLSIEGGEE